MRTYHITIKHDKGVLVIRTKARNKAAAVEIVCRAENCPKSAITHILHVTKCPK